MYTAVVFNQQFCCYCIENILL